MHMCQCCVNGGRRRHRARSIVAALRHEKLQEGELEGTAQTFVFERHAELSELRLKAPKVSKRVRRLSECAHLASADLVGGQFRPGSVNSHLSAAESIPQSLRLSASVKEEILEAILSLRANPIDDPFCRAGESSELALQSATQLLCDNWSLLLFIFNAYCAQHETGEVALFSASLLHADLFIQRKSVVFSKTTI